MNFHFEDEKTQQMISQLGTSALPQFVRCIQEKRAAFLCNRFSQQLPYSLRRFTDRVQETQSDFHYAPALLAMVQGKAALPYLITFATNHWSPSVVYSAVPVIGKLALNTQHEGNSSCRVDHRLSIPRRELPERGAFQTTWQIHQPGCANHPCFD